MKNPSDLIQRTVLRWMNYPQGRNVGMEVIAALNDAGYTVIDREELDREIAYAHQAGVDESAEL